MPLLLFVIPGLVLAFVLLAFSLADDLPAIGHWFWVAAFAIMGLAAAA